MKILTYGTLPSLKAFETAMNNTFGSDEDDVVRYDISVRDGSIDKDMLNELSLIRVWRYVPGKGVGRFETFLDAKQLYELCEALVAVYSDRQVTTDDVSADFWNNNRADWAGDFCSSILSTLGFDWV